MFRHMKPILVILSIFVLVGLACKAAESPTQTPIIQATEPPVQLQPTNTPQPLSATAAPEPITEPEPLAFFVEEFEGDLGNWEYFVYGAGDEKMVSISQDRGTLIFNLGDRDNYVYFMYLPYIYDNVLISVSAENRGRNNNNVSLVCRMSDEGWYEFSVESGGLWYLYAVTDSYHVMANGGAKSLNIGKEVNIYAMKCEGNTITVAVNGVVLGSHQDNKHKLREGNVGFNISSLNVLPIIVEVDWFEIAQP